jgi:hypothetical protein
VIKLAERSSFRSGKGRRCSLLQLGIRGSVSLS